MPNPKLETYKNKATGTVYDYTDAAAQAALAGILDGTDIDSFSDVETALATKVDKVTGKGLSTNDYDNTEKAKVAGAFPRSEQAVLGAKNLWDDSDLRANYTTITETNNGYRVQSSQSDTYTYMASFFTLPDEVKGKDLIFSTTVTKTSGQNFIVVDASNDGTNFTKFFETGATGNISRTYNCGSYSIYRVRFFVTLDTAAVGDVTFGDIMIRLATDTDPTYAPYAMTNKELTEKVQGIIDAATNAADFAAFKTAIGNL